MLHLFAVVLLAASTWASFICPPAHEIYPCECHFFRQKIFCENVTSLTSVREALEGHFEQIIPWLNITNVNVTSCSLPARALGELSVRRFSLQRGNIRKIDKDAFEKQTSLGLLWIADNKLEIFPTEALKHLESLVTLSLAGNFLRRIPDRSMDHLDRILFLILSENRISEIGKNAFPKNLEHLYIAQNLLSTFNGSLQSLNHVKEIYAPDNRLVNIRGEFDGLVHLTYLVLDRSNISDISDSFSNVPSLARLSLSGNRIQDVGNALDGISTMRYLNLSHNCITKLHSTVFQNMKNLDILDLSGNYLKAICPTLKPVTSLSKLILSDMGLKCLTRDCFQKMSNLRILDLSHNRLVDIDAVSRLHFPALMRLRLDIHQLSTFRYEKKYAKLLKFMDNSSTSSNSLQAQYLTRNKKLDTLKIKGVSNETSNWWTRLDIYTQK